MDVFEWVLGLMFAAATLSLVARRLALPYPSLLAVGGAAIALLPYSPDWTLDPRLALTLFVAPVLLDAAYDFSLRDLRRNWLTVAGLAVMSVLVTTVAVTCAPRMPEPSTTPPGPSKMVADTMNVCGSPATLLATSGEMLRAGRIHVLVTGPATVR